MMLALIAPLQIDPIQSLSAVTDGALKSSIGTVGTMIFPRRNGARMADVHRPAGREGVEFCSADPLHALPHYELAVNPRIIRRVSRVSNLSPLNLDRRP
jgi:hypothetical protein